MVSPGQFGGRATGWARGLQGKMATEGDTVKTLIIAAIIITVLFALAGKAVQTEIANQTAKATATAAIMGK